MLIFSKTSTSNNLWKIYLKSKMLITLDLSQIWDFYILSSSNWDLHPPKSIKVHPNPSKSIQNPLSLGLPSPASEATFGWRDGASGRASTGFASSDWICSWAAGRISGLGLLGTDGQMVYVYMYIYIYIQTYIHNCICTCMYILCSTHMYVHIRFRFECHWM